MLGEAIGGNLETVITDGRLDRHTENNIWRLVGAKKYIGSDPFVSFERKKGYVCEIPRDYYIYNVYIPTFTCIIAVMPIKIMKLHTSPKSYAKARPKLSKPIWHEKE